LIHDIVSELTVAISDESERQEIGGQFNEFVQAWKRLYSQFGNRKTGRRHYARALDQLVVVAAGSNLKRRLQPRSNAYGSLAVLSTVFQMTNRMVGFDGQALVANHDSANPQAHAAKQQ
jgi:hypothetical protein